MTRALGLWAMRRIYILIMLGTYGYFIAIVFVIKCFTLPVANLSTWKDVREDR